MSESKPRGALYCRQCGAGLYPNLERQPDGTYDYGETLRHPSYMTVLHAPDPARLKP